VRLTAAVDHARGTRAEPVEAAIRAGGHEVVELAEVRSSEDRGLEAKPCT
jgi:hypothetical protein